MLTLEVLHTLYEAGNVEECLHKMQDKKQYIVQECEWLMLKAKCELKLFLDEKNKNNDHTAFAAILAETLESIVNQHRENEKALLFYINTQVFFLKADLSKALACCNRLISSDDAGLRLKGLYYRYEIYRELKDSENILSDLNMLILFTQRYYSENENELSIAQAKNYIRKGDVYRFFMRDTDNALRAYMESYKYSNDDITVQCRIANFALDNAHYEVAGKAIRNVFHNNECCKSDEAALLFQRSCELIKAGISTKDIVSGILAASTVMKDLPAEYNTIKQALFLLKQQYNTSVQKISQRA